MKKTFCLMMALGILLVAMPVGAEEEVWYYAGTSCETFSAEIVDGLVVIENNSREDIQIQIGCSKPLLVINANSEERVVISELIGNGTDSHEFNFPKIPKEVGGGWLKILRVNSRDSETIIGKNWNSEISVFMGVESTHLFCE